MTAINNVNKIYWNAPDFIEISKYRE